MKKTKTNQSKTEELYELVTSFTDAEVAEFEQHAKRKRSQTEYWRLFDHLRKIHAEKGLAVEQIREPEIKASVVGTGEEWGSYRSLTRSLYRNLLRFLAERYRLFAWDARGGRLFSGKVHHAPYRIGAADVTAWDDVVLGLAGFDRDGREPEHVCVARAVDVELWPLERVAEPVRVEREQGDGLGAGVAMPA